MRLRRMSPATAGALREGVFADPGALVEGLRWIATDLQVPGCDPLEALGVDGRGRLMIVGFAMSADAAAIERALSHWRWLDRTLPAIRTLAPPNDVDFAAAPRVAIAAARLHPASLRLAACIDRPRVEMYQVILVWDGERQGILVEPAGDMAFDEPEPDAAWRGTPMTERAATTGPQHRPHHPPHRQMTSAEIPSETFDARTIGVTRAGQRSRPTGAAERVELTPEEIAEFRKLGTRAAGGATPESGVALENSAPAGPKFVEN